MKLSGFESSGKVELHASEDTLVVLKQRMTAMELLRAARSLQKLATDLHVHLARVCGHCDGCDGECPFGGGDEVELPDYLREEAGIPEKAKLCASVDEDEHTVTISEADYDYRRCVWNKGGVKRAVWRCGSRLDYGAKYCKHSETLEEKPLQQAILNAINSVMDSRDALEVQLMGAMEQELAPIPGETMSLADIDRMLEELEKQFNSLLAEASAAGGTEDYAERFRMISNAMADLKEHKSRIKQVYQENELVSQRLKAASIAMSAYAAELTEWDQSVVYQLVEKVTVLAKDKIRVTFRNGTEVEQEIEQLDWRNAS